MLLAGQLYAMPENALPRPDQAAGGPFTDSVSAWLWMIEQQEAKLNPAQKSLWGNAHDSLRAYVKRRLAFWTEQDILGALYFVIGMIRKGPIGIGRPSVRETGEQVTARVLRYCGAR